jgi:hypothetical protein
VAGSNARSAHSTGPGTDDEQVEVKLFHKLFELD